MTPSSSTIGIDPAKRAAHRAAIVRPGVAPLVRKVENTAASLDALLRAAGGPCDVVLEPTGLVWVPLTAFLVARGAKVFRVDTVKASGFRKILRRNVKTDEVDALALAKLPATDPQGVHPVPTPTPGEFTIDRLVRQRATFIDIAAQMEMRIYCELEACFPDLPGILVSGGGLNDTKLVLLQRYADPHEAQRAGHSGMAATIQEAALRPADELVDAWLKAAAAAVELFAPSVATGKCPVDFAAMQFVITNFVAACRENRERAQALADQISERAQQFDSHAKLMEIPGIGPLIAAFLIGFVGDVGRFRDSKAFVAYCGLNPVVDQTGGSAARRGTRISKSGNRRLRRYLYLAAENARQGAPELAAFYARLTSRGKPHKVAITAVAARVAARIYAVLKRHAAGGPGYEHRTESGERLESKREARAYTRRQFPSKAAIKRAAATAKKEGRAATNDVSVDTGQSNDSPRRSATGPTRDSSTRANTA